MVGLLAALLLSLCRFPLVFLFVICQSDGVKMQMRQLLLPFFFSLSFLVRSRRVQLSLLHKTYLFGGRLGCLLFVAFIFFGGCICYVHCFG